MKGERKIRQQLKAIDTIGKIKSDKTGLHLFPIVQKVSNNRIFYNIDIEKLLAIAKDNIKMIYIDFDRGFISLHG